MAFRTFATFKIQGATPQPLVGSWVSAGLGNPVNSPIVLTLGTMTSAGNDAAQVFKAGDHALLVNVDGTNSEDVTVSAVLNNTLTLGYKTNLGTGTGGRSPVTEYVHASGVAGTGTWIIPQVQANNLFVDLEDGGTGAWLYIGNAYNMSATFRRIVKLAKTSSGAMPFNYGASESFFGNPFSSSELWTLGTANDLYNVSFCVV
jgi:hypothetical protein